MPCPRKFDGGYPPPVAWSIGNSDKAQGERTSGNVKGTRLALKNEAGARLEKVAIINYKPGQLDPIKNEYQDLVKPEPPTPLPEYREMGGSCAQRKRKPP
jgi:hypothetical protein